jgi:signal transduction histidine kinase
VENVLSFSRAEHGRYRISPEPADLAREVRDVLEMFAPLAAARRATVHSTVTPREGVEVDRAAFKQILLNLLDNAVKYGPAGQTVTVGADAADGRVRMWVDDQGPGIPEEERERIWEPYRRIERDDDPAVGGSGIGLAVVHELVQLHRGRVWVETASSGTGARFVVELPAVPEEQIPLRQTGEHAISRGSLVG